MKKQIWLQGAAVLMAALILAGSAPAQSAAADVNNSTTGDVAEVTENSTELADGEYTPDSFSWSGGTGKAKMSCDKILVENGKIYAHIIFGSSYYQYVRSGDEKIEEVVHNGDTSEFLVPVVLNQNYTIMALTTRMSSPHEIEYTIYVELKAAAAGSEESPGIPVNEQYQVLDEEAPAILGLTWSGEPVTTDSDQIRMYHYENGYTLLEIRTTEEAEEAPEEDSDADASALYRNPVLKYLMIPENGEIPAGVDRQVILVQQPVEAVAVTSPDALNRMEEMDLLDRIAGVGIPEEQIPIASVKEAMAGEEPEVAAIGTYDDISYKDLLMGKMDLLIEDAAILEAGDEALYELGKRAVQMKLPVLVDLSQKEQTPEGRAAWQDVYAEIFGTGRIDEK